jgi:hypothetical protein
MRLFPLVLMISLAGTTALVLQACGSDSASGDDTGGDAGGRAEAGTGSETSNKPGTETDGSVADDDASTTNDSGTGDDGGCEATTVSLDAGGGCGTLEFGAVAVPFSGFDASAGNDYAGGAFPAGIYDAVLAERSSANAGSWRETFVSDGNGRFTRIRQINTGSGGGPGPVSRRSGTYAVSGKDVTFTYDCAQNDNVAITVPGSDTLPYEVVTDTCNATYRTGVTGIRISLRRR